MKYAGMTSELFEVNLLPCHKQLLLLVDVGHCCVTQNALVSLAMTFRV